MKSNNVLQEKEQKSKLLKAVMQNKPTSEIIELVRAHSLVPISNIDILNQIMEARAYLEDITNLDTHKIISVHLGWYEEMYRYFEEIKHTEGMNKVMRAKERLLGLHKREEKIVFNKKETVNVTRTATYDFSRLSQAQRDRLEVLMEKMK